MNKTILITGAGSGIGLASARLFEQNGWNVIATMRTPAMHKEMNRQPNVLVTKLDVLDLKSINDTIQLGISRFNKIDLVLNSAAYTVIGTLESAKRENIQRQFAVNVQGLIDVTQAVLPYFRKQKSGMFINISSLGGRIAVPLMPLYNATKFAIEGFSVSLHYELNSIGVQVKIIEPGRVATKLGGCSMDFQHNNNLTEYNEFVTAMLEKFEDVNQPEVFSTPEMIAQLIYQAATDGSGKLRYRAEAYANQLHPAEGRQHNDAFTNMMKGHIAIAS